MLTLTRARIPSALIPPDLASPAPDPIEPSVLCDVRIESQTIVSVTRSAIEPQSGVAAAVSPKQEKVAGRHIDLGGALVFPGFVDAHVHLDKAHTWNRAPNRTGTFLDALETLARDKVNWSHADLMRRAGFALRCAWEHGTGLVRTHVDTGLPWAETSHAAMAELRDTWQGRILLQTVPLCGIENYSGPDGEGLVNLAMKYGACALGGWSLLTPELPRQLDHLMAMARDRGVGLDLHVDENGDPQAEVLRAVAEAVLRNRFPNPVVCGHCCSLAVQSEERQRSTLGLVSEAGVRIISLPLCNLYLQDRRGTRFPRTPLWRGLTLIHDLLDLGVPVACASDNVRDAFYAFGDLDAAEVYLQSVRLGHLDSRLGESVRVVTAAAADIVGVPDRGRITAGSPAHLVAFKAHSFSDLLSRPGAPRRIVHGETLRNSHPPGYEELE